MRMSPWFVLAIAACGSTARMPARPMSATEHYAEARAHEADAAEQDRAAMAAERVAQRDTTYCTDRNIVGQSSSGGVPLSQVTPCWTSPASDRSAHLRRADDLRSDARRHRAVAVKLIDAERTACASVPDVERMHSPSWHRDDILAVEAVRDGGAVSGARIVFRKVGGLSVAWLRDAYACHQAQAAVAGFDTTVMSYCPASLPDLAIEVRERTDGYVVTFTSERDEIGAAILGRAQDLVAPR